MTSTDDSGEIRSLYRISYSLRIKALEMVYRSGTGHVSPCFSMAEILATLYFKVLNVDSRNPSLRNRDRLILSKGHASAIYYAALAEKGFFSTDLLDTYCTLGSALGGHPVIDSLAGIDMTTGSLGNGLSLAVGIAQIGKKDTLGNWIYAIVGDGELQEGLVWEAFMYAGNRHLENLVVIIDRNGLQSGGKVAEIMDLDQLDRKLDSFNFYVQTIDGHDIGQLVAAIDSAKQQKGRPSAIIANTIKGKGVSFMESQASWHMRIPDESEFLSGMSELRKEEAKYG